jgi:TPR repeat protein
VAWYRRSAERGNGLAQYALGRMYFKGHGVAWDPVQAHQWFELSAARDSDMRVDAGEMRAKTETQMTAAQVAEAQKLAHDWKPKKLSEPLKDASQAAPAQKPVAVQ